MSYHFLASERHNLHDELCLIDPPVICFDGESVKIICIKEKKEIPLSIIPIKVDSAKQEWPREKVIAPIFCRAKIKKRKQRKKRKSSEAETIKRLSPRSKCYCFSNVYCFILERLEFKYFSVFHNPSNLKSISLALPNLALMCAAFYRKLLKSKVQVEWYFLIRFTTCNDLVF